MTGLGHEVIADLARDLAAAHERLRETFDEVREEQRKIVRRRCRGIRNRTAELAVARQALHGAIQSSPELFERPRTRSQHGVVYGMRKGSGKLVGDVDLIVARVRKLLPDRTDELLCTKTTPVKAALKKLPADQLAALGAKIDDADDNVTIKVATDDDLERFVELVMADLEEAAP